MINSAISFTQIGLKHCMLACLCFCCCMHGKAQNSKHIFTLITKQQNKDALNFFKTENRFDMVDETGASCIIHAVKSRNLQILKYLLKQHKIDLNAKDRCGKVALDYAIELEGIDENSALILQHIQYDMCTLLVNRSAKVTTAAYDIKLRSFLLKGKPKYDKTLLGFCVDNSPLFVSTAAAYNMSFLGPFVSVITNFLGAFASYSMDRIAHYRRFKKYNRSFLLEECL